jgi:hypothetical protein
LSARRRRVIVSVVPRVLLVIVAVSVAVYAAGCGSRTGLLAPSEQVSNDTFVDDGGHSSADALIPVDSSADALPPIDVAPRPPPNDCPDAAATLIYVITDAGTLLSFDPRTSTFSQIGRIACLTGGSPFSMAVDHLGTAYVVFSDTNPSDDGFLFRVSTRNASCQPTGFVRNQQGFSNTFGMGFATNADGGETLYVAESVASTSALAQIDTTTFVLHLVGQFQPTTPSPELTGTGAGTLFAFYATTPADSAIGQIDKATAQIIGQSDLPGVSQGRAWAFAFWGGDFYTFTAPLGVSGSVVTRYRPADRSLAQVGTYGERIVGAGVSTCAPQQ